MKQHLQSLVSKGQLTEALELMSQISNTQNRDFQTTVILLSSRNAGNDTDNMKGLLDESSYKRSKAQINYAILHLLDNEFDESNAPAAPQPTPQKAAPQPTPQPENKSDTEGGNSSPKAKVYFSYAWGDNEETGESREKIVHDLYESLKADGFDVVRDKEDAQYKDMISEFMKEIGRGDCIVIAISDKYLKSPNCMFEMYEIFRNSKLDKGTFREKIFPIRVESIRLSDPMVLDTYFEHWEQQEKDWEALIIKRGTRISPAQQERYKRIKAIASELGDFLDFLSDINTKTRVELSKDNFEEIKKAIAKRAS